MASSSQQAPAATTLSLNPPVSQSNLRVDGRVFVITGGSQGLGLEVARLLKECGAAGLVLVSRSREKGQEAELLLRQGSNCHVVWLEADLSQADQASKVISRAAEAMKDVGPITGVVNAAAYTGRGNLETTSATEFDLQMAINVRAPFLITQGAAKHIKEQQQQGAARGDNNNKTLRGSIVNVCSVAAHGGAPFVMAYSASKAALVNLTKNNAAELAPAGIRVNGVNMGWCFTDNENTLQTKLNPNWLGEADATVPLGRILRTRDVATTLVFLLSDASALTTGSIVELHPEFAHGMLSLGTHDDAR